MMLRVTAVLLAAVAWAITLGQWGLGFGAILTPKTEKQKPGPSKEW
jgi:hypothetical protein